MQSFQINSVAGSTLPAASVPAGSGNYVQNTTTQQVNANFNIGGSGVIGGDLTDAGALNANLGGSVIQNRSTQQPNANFNISGSGTVGATLSVNGTTGIGTANPPHKLTVSGGPPWTANFWLGSVALDNAAAMAWEPNQSGQSFGIGQTNGGLFFFRSNSAPGMSDSQANYDLSLSDSGDLSAFGHASQARDKGGWVKGHGLHRRDGQHPALLQFSTNRECGVHRPVWSDRAAHWAGFYVIDFGFVINDRFISLTPQASRGTDHPGATFVLSDQNDTQNNSKLVVGTYPTSDAQNLSDAKFMVVVY